jgi:hypothetical protein
MSFRIGINPGDLLMEATTSSLTGSKSRYGLNAPALKRDASDKAP